MDDGSGAAPTTQGSNGCLHALGYGFAVLVAGFGWLCVLSVGSVRQSPTKAGYSYVVSDLRGAPLEPPPVAVGDGVPLLVFVAVPCLLALAIAFASNRGARRWLGAVVVSLGFSVLAVGGGIYVLTGTIPVACRACVHPELVPEFAVYEHDPPSTAACEHMSGNPFSGVDSYDLGVGSVGCPAAFVQHADVRRRWLDGMAITLIVVGVLSGLAAVGIGWRARSMPKGPSVGARASPSESD